MIRKASKLLCALFVLGAVTVMAPAKARAVSDLGAFCWQMSPFVDTIRVNFLQVNGGGLNTLYNLAVRWRAGTVYQMLGSGAASTDTSAPGAPFGMGFEADRRGQGNDGLFNNNKSCSFYGLITNFVTLGGTWNFECSGGEGRAIFTNSGTLTFLPFCPIASDEGAVSGPLAGQ